MNKLRLWRVDSTSKTGCQAPSFWVETTTKSSQTREEAEQEAIKIAKEQSGLGRFPESWIFTVTHLEDHFLLKTHGWEKWVKQGVYKRDDNGTWRKNRQASK